MIDHKINWWEYNWADIQYYYITNPLFGMKDGLEEGYIEEKGWMKERMDGSFIYHFICSVKDWKIDANDSLLYLI